MKFQTGLLLLLVVGILTSCTGKRVTLFQTGQELDTGDLPVYYYMKDSLPKSFTEERTVRIEDRVYVKYLNRSILADNPLTSESVDNSGYLVDPSGAVFLPSIGKLHVAGKTRNEIRKLIEDKLSSIYKNPSVDVEMVNRNVNVLGFVGKPGVIELLRERENVIEVLARSGGFSRQGNPRKVKIIRMSNQGVREVLVIDFGMLESLSPIDLVLHDQDIVYVPPRKIVAFTEGFGLSATLFSLVTGIFSIVLALTRTF